MIDGEDAHKAMDIKAENSVVPYGSSIRLMMASPSA